METNEENARLRTMKIIWGALFASQILYAVIVELIFRASRTTEIDWSYPQLTQMAVSATVCFVASIIGPKRGFFKNNRAPREEVKIEQLFTPFVTQLALSEAVCIFGFFVAFQSQNPVYLYPFLAVSALCTLYRFPLSKDRLLSFYFD